MSPDDPRHGANAGYVAGCRDQCCRDAAARYERGISWDHLQGKRRKVPILGARRRIQALLAIGWSMEDMSRRVGKSRAWIHVTINANQSGLIYRRNFDIIAALYEELSMTLPPETRCTGRQRAWARRNGFAPPLAWDNIDDPNEQPRLSREHVRRMDDYDPVVVERILAGDRLEPSVAERRAVVERLWTRGLGPVAIAARCGFDKDTVGKDIERLGLKRGAA